MSYPNWNAVILDQINKIEYEDLEDVEINFFDGKNHIILLGRIRGKASTGPIDMYIVELDKSKKCHPNWVQKTKFNCFVFPHTIIRQLGSSAPFPCEGLNEND